MSDEYTAPAAPQEPASAPGPEVTNEYDTLLAEAPKPAKPAGNEYDALIVDLGKERQQRVRANIMGAQGSTPDAAAKAAGLAQKTGLPADIVERNLAKVETDQKLNEYDGILERAPKLSAWLGVDPVNAKVAADDYESLSFIDKFWTDLKGALFNRQSDMGALSALKVTEHLQILEDAKARRDRGEIVPPFQQRMLDLEDKVRAAGLKEITGGLGQYLEKKQAAAELPQNPHLIEMQKAAQGEDWASGMWDAFKKDPLGIIATVTAQSAIDLPGQIGAGIVAGPAGAGGYSFVTEYISGVMDVLQEKKVDVGNPAAILEAFSNPALMDEVRSKAATKAAVVGGFDALSFGLATKTMGFGLKGAKARHAVNIPAQVVTQGVLGGAGEAFGSLAADRKVDPFAVVAEVLGEAGMAPAEIGGAKTWRNLHREDMTREQRVKFDALPVNEQIAVAQGLTLDKMIAVANDTKLAKLAPAKLQEFIAGLGEQSVFVPSESVATYMQDMTGMQARLFAEKLGISDQIAEATQTGQDIVIPLAKYVTDAGDAHAAWRNDIRTEVDGFSVRQAQEDTRVREERLKLAVDRFEAQLQAGIAEVDATTRVYEDIRDKLKTLGQFTTDAAEQQAALYAARYEARAARNKGSYLDAWDAYSKAGPGKGLDIQTQLSERVGAYPPDQLDVLLNSIRSGRVAPTKTDADANEQFANDRTELKAALDSMGIDTGKLTNPQIRQAIKQAVEKNRQGQTYEQPVYHGTPHIFDKFDLSKIGTGEGAQAFGWGLYFAGKKEIAAHYRNVLSGGQAQWTVGGKPVSYFDALEAVRQALKPKWDENRFGSIIANGRMLADIMVSLERGASISEVRNAYKDVAGAGLMIDTIEETAKLNRPGRLLHVEIPDDGEYLNWDKPLSTQPEALLNKLETLWKKYPALNDWQGGTGAEFYAKLSAVLSRGRGNGEKAASAALREAGIPGIQYLDATSRAEGEGTHNYVLFDDSLAKITSFEQEARGQINFTDNRVIITLFQSRDLSTLIHESGHLFLSELEFDAKAQNAPEQMVKDWQAVLDWLGSKDGYITRDMHEQFARGFETYAMGGKAPSSALASAFRSFKRWLTQIYRRLASLNAPITPEIREVFNRMLATDEQIANAMSVQGLNPVFKDAESAGMTKAAFAAFTARVNEVVNEAEEKLLAKTMESIRKQKDKEWKADERIVREEISNEVLSESGQQALALLTKGEFPVGTTPEVLKGVKLTKEDIVALYGDEAVLGMLPAGIYRDRAAGPGAMSPDELAQLVGLGNGKELIERLMQLEAQRRAMALKGDKRSVARAKIDEETAQRMAERYGDPLNDGTIEQEAMAAVHSDKQGALMAVQLRVLAQKAGHTGTITLEDIENWAANAIGEMSAYKATQSTPYQRAEREAGKKVTQALIKGDFVAAFKAQQDQMVSFALYRESLKAAKDVERTRKLADRYASARTIKNMDQAALDAIHEVLEEYDFKNRSGKLLAERTLFNAWRAEQEKAGHVVLEPPRLKGAQAKHVSQMTMDELRGLHDTIAQMAHLGRLKKEFIVNGEKRDMDALLGEMEATASRIKQRGVSQFREGESGLQEQLGDLRHQFTNARSSLIKMERLLEIVDDDKTGRGIFTRTLYKPMADSQTVHYDLEVDANKKLKAIYDKVPMEQRKAWAVRHSVPELQPGLTLTKEQIMALAMNVGNASNLDKVLKGRKWSEAGVQAVLNKHLTKEEWQFTQDVWDLIDSYWSQIEALEKDVNGFAPKKVEAKPVQTPFGALKGGYYPMEYNRHASFKADKIARIRETTAAVGELFAPGRAKPSTRAGSTHERSEGFNAPVLLSLNVINSHLSEVTQDIAYRKAVMQVYKVITQGRFRAAVQSAVGPEYEAQILPWLQRIANEGVADKVGLSGVDAALRTMRLNVSIVGMGLRISTMLQQTVGYSNSMQRLGAPAMANGFKMLAADPKGMAATVFAKSGEMRHRMNNLDRDMRANMKRFTGKEGVRPSVARIAFRGIGYFDMAVTLPTWVGAYHQGLAQKMTDADAVYYADKMVRDTQGAGGNKDMSSLQNGSEAMKLFTMFGSYANVLYNAQLGLWTEGRYGNMSPKLFAKLFQQFMFLMVLPPLLSALISGKGPGDDEDWVLWAARNVGFGAFQGIPLLRDAASYGNNKVGGQYAGGGVTLTPISGIFENIAHLVGDAVHIVKGEETSKTSLKNLFNTVGGVLGLPLGQPGQTAQYILDASTGAENPEDLWDWMRGLTIGPPHNKK